MSKVWYLWGRDASAGGSYLKLSQNGVEQGSQGDYIVKAANYMVPGTASSLPQQTPDFKKTEVKVTTRNAAKWASE